MIRILVTLGCAAIAVGLQFVPAPGVELEVPAGQWPVRPLLGLGMLGVMPLVSAALLVELVALLHPRWRTLRVGGRDARAGVRRASFVVALLLAALQAWLVLRWAESLVLFDDLAQPRPGLWPALVFGAALVGATALFALLVEWITRHGLGNGFSVLIATAALTEIGMALADVMSTLDNRVHAVDWLALCSLSAAIVYVTALVLRRRTDREGPVPPVHVPAPASGLAPIGGAAVAYQIVALGFFPDSLLVEGALPPPLHARYYWDVFVPVAVLLAALLTLLFYRGNTVADCWMAWERDRNDAAPSRTAVLAATITARWRALSWTVPLILGAAVADTYFGSEVPGLSAIALVVLTAIARDIVSTWRFATAHGAIVSVDEIHRLYLLPIVLEELQAAGIPAHPRGASHRALLQFFGPYVPVEIVVPTERADEATALIRARLLASAPGSG